MSSRRVAALFIAAVLVILGAIWISSQRHLDRDVATGQSLLPELQKSLDNVTEVRVARADGQHTTLKKNAGAWQVIERSYAADIPKLRKLLQDIADLKVVEEKTSNPAHYAALGVEETTGIRIDVVTAKKTWVVLAGKNGGMKSGYVRLADSKQSFLASPQIVADVEPKQWLDHAIVDIAAARIQSVALKPASGASYQVSREKKEQENFTVANIPPKRKLSREGAGNSLANGLEGLSLEDVHPAADTEAETSEHTQIEHSQAIYRTFDGLEVTVSGRKESSPGLKPQDSKVEHLFVTVAAAATQPAMQSEAKAINARVAGHEFEIPSYKYAALFQSLDELLEPLPAKPEKPAKAK